MKNSTRIIFFISHLIAFLYSLYAITLMLAFSNNKGDNVTEVLLFGIVCSVFFALFYFLFKEIKTYLIISLIFYLLISPIIIILITDLIDTIYLSFLYKEYDFYKDTSFQLYIFYLIIYLYSFITIINLIRKNYK